MGGVRASAEWGLEPHLNLSFRSVKCEESQSDAHVIQMGVFLYLTARLIAKVSYNTGGNLEAREIGRRNFIIGSHSMRLCRNEPEKEIRVELASWLRA